MNTRALADTLLYLYPKFKNSCKLIDEKVEDLAFTQGDVQLICGKMINLIQRKKILLYAKYIVEEVVKSMENNKEFKAHYLDGHSWTQIAREENQKSNSIHHSCSRKKEKFYKALNEMYHLDQKELILVLNVPMIKAEYIRRSNEVKEDELSR